MEILLTILIGFAGGFVGSLVGSGGLITIPFLIFLGLPPQIALATNKLGSAGLALGSTLSFWKSQKIRWEYVKRFIPISIVGAFIGSYMLLNIPDGIINYIIAGIILTILPLVIFNRHMGIKSQTQSSRKQALGYIAFFGYAIFTAFFGAGGGTLVMFITLYFFGFDFLEVHATNKIPWMFTIAITLTIFILSGLVWFSYGIPLMIGAFIGSYAGGKLALHKGNKWLKMVFSVAAVLAALRLIFQ